MDSFAPWSRPAAGAIALVAFTGLSVQFDASTALTGSPVEALWVMLRYFTILANILIVVTFFAIAAGWQVPPCVLGGVTLAIMLVGIVYGLLLDGLLELSGGAALADVLLHKVTPLLVPLYWLTCASRGGIARLDPWLWACLPLGYFAYALIRTQFEGISPYPFMNPAKVGWAGVASYALVMGAAFVGAGYALLWLDRQLAGRHR